MGNKNGLDQLIFEPTFVFPSRIDHIKEDRVQELVEQLDSLPKPQAVDEVLLRVRELAQLMPHIRAKVYHKHIKKIQRLRVPLMRRLHKRWLYPCRKALSNSPKNPSIA